MAQGPSDTILVAIRITLRIWESKVRNPDPPDRRRFVLSECISCSECVKRILYLNNKKPARHATKLVKACNRGMTFKNTQDHYNCCYCRLYRSIISCCYNISI